MHIIADKVNIVYYKLSNYYKPNYDSGINVLDKKLRLKWPGKKWFISKKDKDLLTFDEFKKKFNYL